MSSDDASSNEIHRRSRMPASSHSACSSRTSRTKTTTRSRHGRSAPRHGQRRCRFLRARRLPEDADSRSISFRGQVNNEVLRRFTATFDHSRSQLQLEPNTSIYEPLG